jgi:hypothetical protein
MIKEEFIQAIQSKKKVRISFNSIEDQRLIVRKCAPMDYGPSRRAQIKNDRYHLWNYEGDTKFHSLSINPERISKLEVLDETFDPAEFVTWNTTQSKWFIPRDWGKYS